MTSAAISSDWQASGYCCSVSGNDDLPILQFLRVGVVLVRVGVVRLVVVQLEVTIGSSFYSNIARGPRRVADLLNVTPIGSPPRESSPNSPCSTSQLTHDTCALAHPPSNIGTKWHISR
ncbi:hypothetical protein VFPPC_17618 [Pochonia chlamydosporia 170]|uniref:Uncharacterized protein n=1 Tax=Pochonia chlamydosporia 170 TaxID=1380566 RepID=A0A219ARJ0_METCM|nr:hypothetical protein VFPPC_17618 [Pochonia chlamydosporia 170]OWT43219.1 hypothetical protein VFPPC_17618 [Pochonia chlamydosporia 170]